VVVRLKEARRRAERGPVVNNDPRPSVVAKVDEQAIGRAMREMAQARDAWRWARARGVR
jgi:hypothetical protein